MECADVHLRLDSSFFTKFARKVSDFFQKGKGLKNNSYLCTILL
jgi:hypothetical protein